MIPAKGTPTLKLNFDSRHSVFRIRWLRIWSFEIYANLYHYCGLVAVNGPSKRWLTSVGLLITFVVIMLVSSKRIWIEYRVRVLVLWMLPLQFSYIFTDSSIVFKVVLWFSSTFVFASKANIYCSSTHHLLIFYKVCLYISSEFWINYFMDAMLIVEVTLKYFNLLNFEL